MRRRQDGLLAKLDELIGDATKAKEAIEARRDDPRAANQQLVQCVKRGQDSFKKVVNLNKNYYDVLSR